MTEPTDDALIAEYNRLREHKLAESKRFDEYLKPYKTRMEEIENIFLTRLNERKADNTKTDSGTAYKSNLMNISIENRDALLDAALENWETWGGEMLKFSVLVAPVRAYMDAHEGQLPPGITISWITRVNINRG